MGNGRENRPLKAQDIDEQGALIVRLDNGFKQHVVAGDVVKRGGFDPGAEGGELRPVCRGVRRQARPLHG